MITKENIQESIQNKNFVMFFTSVIFMCGILSFFSTKPIIPAVIITAFFIFTLLAGIFSIKRVTLLIFIFYFGFFITMLKIKNSDDLLTLTPVNGVFTGRIISIPTCSDNKTLKFIMNIENVGNENTQGKTLVAIQNNDVTKSLKIGQRVELTGSLRRPFHSTNPSQFDYSSYLKNYNIFTVLYNNDGEIKYLDDNLNFKWSFLQKLNNARNNILEIHSHYLNSPNLEILGGIVFGNDAVAPPEDIRNSFINSGLLHILAASGMNVAFIYTFLFYILQFLKFPYKIRVISGIAAIIIYVFMTGLGPSVIRAALMLIFILIGKLIDRDAHSISLLSLVAVLMLLYNPAYINDVSFQLSFMVTLGLITSANILSQKLPQIPNWIKAPVLIPIIAQLYVIPIQMYYFNSISLYSIFANISIASVLSIISFSGFISSLLAIIKPIAEFVCMTFDFYTNYLLNILVYLSNFFANLPNCILQTTHPDITQIILYYLMLLFSTYLIKSDKYKNAAKVILLTSLILVLSTIHLPSKNLEIITFDVGNADCFLIKTPQNKYFFIDTGKSAYKSGNTQAKIIMLKYLKDRGIKNIEGIIVTHFDNDHSGGTNDLINNLKVKNLYINTTKTETETAESILQNAKDINQEISITKNNSIIYEEKDLTLKTFKSEIEGKNQSNDSSTITLLKYKNFEMLFMADAGITSFERIKNYIPHNIEVLKVGHHGGPRVVDKQMIEHINNDVSIISTGVNTFGHPNQGTLDILRKTIILRTDMLNSIKISVNEDFYKIFSYDSQDKKYKLKEIFKIK